MLVTCPQCGAQGQEAGKYCENCGVLIPLEAGQVDATPQPSADSQAAQPPNTVPVTSPQDASGSAAPATPAAAGGPHAQFAVVHGDQATPDEGFTITRPGEFLVGRLDADSQSAVDVDLRQWVAPIEVGGQKQYLVHRKQCYIGLSADGTVTIKAAPGTENDTLIRPAGDTAYIPLSQLSTVRTPGPDASYPLQTGDRLYLGDPDALQYYQSNDPTAQGTYVVLELLGA